MTARLSARPLAAVAALAAAAALAAPRAAAAQTGVTRTLDDSVTIGFGAFVDGYYAWDGGRPPSRDRSFAGGTLFTTQPSRHNEFNLNLAHVEATLSAPRYRGRLAVQTGTSVQANYIGEPRTGQVSGPSLAQLLQEAVAGVRVAEGLWVEGGVFFSHMGMEGWISRDNPTYTRSLVADYSPYYSSGVRAQWAATPKLGVRVDLVNGWQNIGENNDGKGAGLRLDYAPAAGATLSYYNFFSEESGTRLRTFNGVGAKVARGAWTFLGEFDLGTQRRAPGTAGSSTWYNTVAIVRRQVTPRVGLSARVERADDRDGIVLGTGARTVADAAVPNAPFRATGGSLGLDVQPVSGSSRVLWRTEARGWRNRDAIFPDGPGRAPRRDSGFLVSSLALSF